MFWKIYPKIILWVGGIFMTLGIVGSIPVLFSSWFNWLLLPLLQLVGIGFFIIMCVNVMRYLEEAHNRTHKPISK